MRYNRFFEFSNNVSIIAGLNGLYNGVKKLHDLGGYRVFVITDNDIAKTDKIGLVKEEVAKIEQMSIGKTYTHLDGPVTLLDVDKIYSAYRTSGCDSILAVGGQRAAFASKALNLLLSTNSRNLLEYVGIDCAVRKTTIPFGIVPTTFSTGTEVSNSTLIIDDKTKLQHEFVTDVLQPAFCVLDPKMLVKTEKKDIYLGIMDAIAFDIESYTSLRTNQIVKSFAKMSMFTIRNAFQQYIVNDDRNSLFDLQRAGALTAVSYSNTFSGIIHAIAHTLTAMYGIRHENAVCAIFAPCLEFNKEVCKKEYIEMLLFSLGAKEFSTLDDEGRLEAFINMFKNLLKYMADTYKIELKLSSYGIKEEDLEKIAEVAILDGSMITTPKQPTKEDIINILKESL